jgi:hypothetical protein
MGYMRVLNIQRTEILHYTFFKQLMSEKIIFEIHHRSAKKNLYDKL